MEVLESEKNIIYKFEEQEENSLITAICAYDKEKRNVHLLYSIADSSTRLVPLLEIRIINVKQFLFLLQKFGMSLADYDVLIKIAEHCNYDLWLVDQIFTGKIKKKDLKFSSEK